MRTFSAIFGWIFGALLGLCPFVGRMDQGIGEIVGLTSTAVTLTLLCVPLVGRVQHLLLSGFVWLIIGGVWTVLFGLLVIK